MDGGTDVRMDGSGTVVGRLRDGRKKIKRYGHGEKRKIYYGLMYIKEFN
jgi:hypothetical protein